MQCNERERKGQAIAKNAAFFLSDLAYASVAE
jgi:hypothetical protein